MIQFGIALRKAREDRGYSRRRLWLRIKAKFDDPICYETIKGLEMNPSRTPHEYVRRQISSILESLR